LSFEFVVHLGFSIVLVADIKQDGVKHTIKVSDVKYTYNIKYKVYIK